MLKLSIEEEELLEKYEHLIKRLELSVKNSNWIEFNNYLRKL